MRRSLSLSAPMRHQGRAADMDGQADSLETSIEIAPGYVSRRPGIEALLKSFDAGGETLHRKRNTVKKMQLDDVDVVVKSFKALSGIRAFIYGRLRKSKAQRSFEYTQQLLELGIDTPAPVAFYEEHRGGLLGASFFVSEYYPHDYSMSYALPSPDQGPAPEDAEALITAFMCFTFQLHEAGVLHIDHNPSNTLVRRHGQDWQFAIIDINRMQFGSLGLPERMKNLVRLTDDVDVMKLMARIYAGLANESPERCEELLFRLKRRHWRKQALKRRLKQLTGRHPR